MSEMASRTGIVATIGPASLAPERLRALRDAGMTMARLNGSHGDLAWHGAAIAALRAMDETLPILLDIPGRKIRTGLLAHEPAFAAGDRLVLTTDAAHDGTEKVPVNYEHLHDDLALGATILADDGTLAFTVEAVTGRDIVCVAQGAGVLRSRKGINVPQVDLRTPPVTDRDRAMVDFARAQGVDFIGISFVDSAAHVAAVRELVGGASPRIVAKVENQAGLDAVEEIVAAADAIMIDRGDLSVETNLEGLALAQKRILAVAQRGGKPAIVATEMLHTMIAHPFPTKAEISDITNAVLDGAAAVMLSGETAIGQHGTAAVALMRRVADAAEAHMAPAQPLREVAVPEAVGAAARALCDALPISKVVAVTLSGFSARSLAIGGTGGPRQPILAVTNDATAARSFNLLPGVTGVAVDVAFTAHSTDHIPQCLETLWRRGLIDLEDLILVAAVGYPRAGNTLNLLETHKVADLAAALGWPVDNARRARSA